MTKTETIDLATLCKQLLPRTTDHQAALLADEVLPALDYRAAKEAIRRHAMEEEEQRLNLPRLNRILRGIEAGMAGPPAVRVDHAVQEAVRRATDEYAAKQNCDKSIEEARAFCEQHRDELEGWRAELLRAHPFLEKHMRGRGRDTFDSPTLMGLIHREFHSRGSAPVAVGAGDQIGDTP